MNLGLFELSFPFPAKFWISTLAYSLHKTAELKTIQKVITYYTVIVVYQVP